ncbi:UNVERIFIED_CONTAM: hypothetical protein PYX00_006658 [Menopon gallinae]|uniref:Rac GTPase-activating protein 1 n=1 Tax=Menopon gallinae TaxID=328185 RepID=A0AAW2HVV6_9NEOP
MCSEKTLSSMLDDYQRLVNTVLENDCTSEFLMFLTYHDQMKMRWKESVSECKRLKLELDSSNLKISELEKKLNRARVLLDMEKKQRVRAEAKRDELMQQVIQIEDILSCVRKAGDKLANETREKLDRFLSTTHTKLRASGDFKGIRLDTIDEINSTGSLLSDLSFSRSEDFDMNASLSEMGVFQKPRPSVSPHKDEINTKKRRSSGTRGRAEKIQKCSAEHLVATTTVTVPKVGPAVAFSKIETFPERNEMSLKPSAPPETSSETDSEISEAVQQIPQTPIPNVYSSNKLFTRSHCFRNKTLLKPSEDCAVCLKKITFSNKISFCADCRVVAHPECRDKIPLPCITVVDTPRGATFTTLSDYCSRDSPMVPPLIVRCVIEVEARGLNEVGIYRVPGAERDVKALKERFLRGKGVCSLSGYDIHVICGTIKDFLRSLNEPLVTYALWSEFIRAIEHPSRSDKFYALYQAIAQLPQPNRDTLAFMMQHLQRVAQSPVCKMPTKNLAKVFGPTIVGYSSMELGRNDMYAETSQQTQVIECLLELPNEYWQNFINVEQTEQLATPLRTDTFAKRTRGKNRKIFSTPPAK